MTETAYNNNSDEENNNNDVTPSDNLESSQQLELSTPPLTTTNGTHDKDEEDAQEDDESTTENRPSAEGMQINLEIKHPLENEWSFWYDKRPAAGKRVRGEQESYESNLREVGNFGTVEDFWRYYNHMVKPSRIENNSNYHFFKKGIKPMWEDAQNVKGGKWVLTIKSNDKNTADTLWENVVLALVGETLDTGDEICGAVFSKRKAGDRIAVWNRNHDDKLAIMNIGDQLKGMLGGDLSKFQTSYQNHEDSMKSGASYSNPTRYKI